jgi:hypothetical protein
MGLKVEATYPPDVCTMSPTAPDPVPATCAAHSATFTRGFHGLGVRLSDVRTWVHDSKFQV